MELFVLRKHVASTGALLPRKKSGEHAQCLLSIFLPRVYFSHYRHSVGLS
jgi:hypothetical protein